MGLTYSTPTAMLATTYIPDNDEDHDNNRSSNEISESDTEVNRETKIMNKNIDIDSGYKNTTLSDSNVDNYDHGKALFLLQQIIDSQNSNIEDLSQQNKMLNESLAWYKKLYFEQSAALSKQKQFENNQNNINSTDEYFNSTNEH